MSELKLDKGYYGGSCNRTACQKEHSAFYFNHSTKKYYCSECASAINRMNPESFDIFGHVLCTYGRNEENVEVAPTPDPFIDKESLKIRRTNHHIFTSKGDNIVTQPIEKENLPGRNYPCICGSGLKYKKCCLFK